MSEIAYLITSDHFKIEEVDFEKLKSYTNNIILKYNVNFHSFRRELFELDRLNLNIGVLIESYDCSLEELIKDFVNAIKGFNINIGVWIDYSGDRELELYNILTEKFSDNFIVGLRYFGNKLSNYSPIWEYNGDIADSNIKILNDISKKKYKVVFLINDYKTIYKENNMKPIISTYKI